MIRKSIVPIAFIFLLSGCSVLKPIAPLGGEKGGKTVCILFNDTGFKTEVVGNLNGALSKMGYRVITGDVRQAKYCNARDYGAVVYMAEYWVWHTPLHTKRYYSKHGEASNTIFLITSGDPDVTIKKPFDAVTSASIPDNVESVTNKILSRLEVILK